MWFISIRGDGGGTCPRPPRLRGQGSGSRCRRYPNDPQLRFLFYFAPAAFWSGAAVAVIIGLLAEADIAGGSRHRRAKLYSWPDIQLDNGVVPSTQKNALDSTLLAFQSSNLNSSEAGSMRICRV